MVDIDCDGTKKESQVKESRSVDETHRYFQIESSRNFFKHPTALLTAATQSRRAKVKGHTTPRAKNDSRAKATADQRYTVGDLLEKVSSTYTQIH